MKCIIVLTVALIAFVAAYEEGIDLKVENECIEKSGVSQEQLRKLRQREQSDDKAVHEYLLCILKKGNFFSEENGFNVEKFVASVTSKHLEEEVARELAAKCLGTNGQKSTPAEWAYRGISCLDDNKIEDLIRTAREKFAENNNDDDGKE